MPQRPTYRIQAICLALLCVVFAAGLLIPRLQAAAPAADDMNNARLETLIKRIDPAAQGHAGFWQFALGERVVSVITDERSNRMRILTPVAKAADLDPARLLRLMQANFDSALDARYGIARDVLWAAFLHPLASLTEEDFLGGVGQVVNLANTFGTSYSSGALTFGGGDSDALRGRELIEELRRKGRERGI